MLLFRKPLKSIISYDSDSQPRPLSIVPADLANPLTANQLQQKAELQASKYFMTLF